MSVSATDVAHVSECYRRSLCQWVAHVCVTHIWVPAQLVFGYQLAWFQYYQCVECYWLSSCLWVIPMKLGYQHSSNVNAANTWYVAQLTSFQHYQHSSDPLVITDEDHDWHIECCWCSSYQWALPTSFMLVSATGVAHVCVLLIFEC